MKITYLKSHSNLPGANELARQPHLRDLTHIIVEPSEPFSFISASHSEMAADMRGNRDVACYFITKHSWKGK